jgi:hypothetical protein
VVVRQALGQEVHHGDHLANPPQSGAASAPPARCERPRPPPGCRRRRESAGSAAGAVAAVSDDQLEESLRRRRVGRPRAAGRRLIRILNLDCQDCHPTGPFFPAYCDLFLTFLLIFRLFWGLGGVCCRIPVCLWCNQSSGTGSGDGPMDFAVRDEPAVAYVGKRLRARKECNPC